MAEYGFMPCVISHASEKTLALWLLAFMFCAQLPSLHKPCCLYDLTHTLTAYAERFADLCVTDVVGVLRGYTDDFALLCFG
jgi:hypothetical protein